LKCGRGNRPSQVLPWDF